ncbi:hypothetical protein KL86DES1_20990 [uncultured Desulfovibrio sp.]|uniref:Uncharacterized protein n=1 Tax=uncultured Desulfovibrio sp. TaxID=167968 RepID=A0A212L641_9BACT|nr:hypothetical protein KL86DES1_20990 [uncultured Desulfovibrio sp.]VZH33891.1 conserved protein of unknown function [Desulfovibrio sp. 86]
MLHVLITNNPRFQEMAPKGLSVTLITG